MLALLPNPNRISSTAQIPALAPATNPTTITPILPQQRRSAGCFSYSLSLHADLLRQARQLALKEPRRPSQASLRRAISASYYALFHLLVDEAPNRSSCSICTARWAGSARSSVNASPMPPRRGASTVFHQASPGGLVRISRRRGERLPGAAAQRKNARQRRRPGPATGSRAVLHRRSPVRVHRRYAGRARPSRTLHRRSPARSPGPIRSPNTTTGMTRSTSVLSTPARRAPARKTWPGIPRHPPRRLRRERSGRWMVVDDDCNDQMKILPGRNKVLLTASY